MNIYVALNSVSAANRRRHNTLMGRREQVVVSPGHLFQFVPQGPGVDIDTWEEQLVVKDTIVAKRLVAANSAADRVEMAGGTHSLSHYRRWEVEKLLKRPVYPRPDANVVAVFQLVRDINRVTSAIINPILWDRVKHGIGIGRVTGTALVRQTVERREGKPGKPDIALIRAKLGTVRGLSPAGVAAGEILVEHFGDLFSATYNLKLDKWISQVGMGDAKREDVLAGYYDRITRAAAQALRADNDYKVGIATGHHCPKCGKPMLRKLSRFGVMQACSGYPDCRTVQKYDMRPPQSTGENCPQCGGALQIKESWYGDFIGCHNYPLCDYKRKIA